MGDRKQPNPAPGTPGSTAPAQRRPDPPPPPPRKVCACEAPTAPAGFQLGDVVVNRFAHGCPAMSVAGMRSATGGRWVLCTWTEADGQAYHEWVSEGSLEMARGKRPVPSKVAPLTHVRCGKPVSIAALRGDVALYVWCETCCDLVEEGELFPAMDETAVRLQVDRERVRPVHGHEAPTVETRP